MHKLSESWQMGIQDWDEFRTAFQVARLGTVSGAAEVLGVHHATVIRHIDALEARLGVKLFQRHARGYTPTEVGLDLQKVAAVTEEQLAQFVGRVKGRCSAMTGELVVTTVTGYSSLVTTALARFQELNPDLKIRLLSDNRVYRLEYGEAHVAIRAGSKPQEPDNVVQHLADVSPHLCAARSYVRRFGLPADVSDFAQHRFVGSENQHSPAPFAVWLREHVPEQSFVFRASEVRAQEVAVQAGIGIGFVADQASLQSADLQVVLEPQPAWQSPLWLVTHVDLHRSPKVQAVLAFLKEEAREW